MEMKATRVAYGEALKRLGEENDKIVVFDADVGNATYTQTFQKAFPERFYQMGIAEANMVCAAAGIADMDFIPFVSAFAVFGIGRAYDQVRNTVAYGNCNVKLAMTHGGLTGGPDGGSHQAIEDIALTRVLPNVRVLCPCDETAVYPALRAAAEYEGPVYIRLSRMATEVYGERPFQFGGSNVMREGADAVVFTCGIMVSQCLHAAELLAAKGIELAVVDLYSIKPIDAARIREYAAKCGVVFTAEEHSIYGGLGDAVACVLESEGKYPMHRIGVQDRFGTSADPEVIIAEYGLDAAGVAETIEKTLRGN